MEKNKKGQYSLLIAYHNNFPDFAFFETVDKPEKKIKFTGTPGLNIQCRPGLTPVEIIHLICSICCGNRNAQSRTERNPAISNIIETKISITVYTKTIGGNR